MRATGVVGPGLERTRYRLLPGAGGRTDGRMDGLSPHRRIAAGTGQLTVLIEVGTLGLFFAASIALALAPGPDNFFVLAQSAAHGVGAGLMITLGLCTGLILHTTAVALGVAVIFQTSALAFNGLKLVGATYLLYLAWQSVRARPEELEARREQTLSPRRLFGRGVIMNITNPKVAIFFLQTNIYCFSLPK